MEQPDEEIIDTVVDDQTVIDPEPDPTVTAEQVLTNQVATLTNQMAELQRKNTDATTENATIRQRLAEVEGRKSNPADISGGGRDANPYDTKGLADMFVTDPLNAEARLAGLIANAASESEKRTLEKVRAEGVYNVTVVAAKESIKAEGLELFEDAIAGQAHDICRNEKIPFEQAVTKSIGIWKVKRDTVTGMQPKDVAIPAGAKGEGGTNPPPPKPLPAEKVKTVHDYVREQNELAIKRATAQRL